MNDGAIFQRVLRGVEDDRGIFAQSLRAEAGARWEASPMTRRGRTVALTAVEQRRVLPCLHSEGTAARASQWSDRIRNVMGREFGLSLV